MVLYYIHVDGRLMATRYSEQEKDREVTRLSTRFPGSKITVMHNVIEE